MWYNFWILFRKEIDYFFLFWYMVRGYIKLVCKIYFWFNLEIFYWFLCVLQIDFKLEMGGNLVGKWFDFFF